VWALRGLWLFELLLLLVSEHLLEFLVVLKLVPRSLAFVLAIEVLEVFLLAGGWQFDWFLIVDVLEKGFVFFFVTLRASLVFWLVLWGPLVAVKLVVDALKFQVHRQRNPTRLHQTSSLP
jgi:hypothetical protein